MNCRIQVPRSLRRNSAGMTVLELMVAGGIGSIVLTAVAMLTVFSARSFVALGNYSDLDRASRNALDLMSREIRSTKSLTSFTTSKLTFNDSDDKALVYTYSPTAHTLTREKSGVKTVLLQQCDLLNFEISQRNPSNAFTFYPATNASLAKLIDVSWKCSRTILGAKVNTESVQTAKIVIRN